MSASKLSNSFSSSELGRINSYREQRMLIRPTSSHAEGESLGFNARNDLESIQQSLKNNILKRKETLNSQSEQSLGADPFESVLNQLDREASRSIYQPKSGSPETQSPADTARTRHFYKYAMLDSTLNTIEENPLPPKGIIAKQQYRENRQNLGGSKQLQGTSSINKNLIQRHKPSTAQTESRPYIAPTASISAINNSGSTKVLPVKQQFAPKREEPRGTETAKAVSKQDSLRISRKVELLKEEISRMPFRRRADIEAGLQQVLDLLRQHQ